MMINEHSAEATALDSPTSSKETARVQGEVLVSKVRALIHEGNVRRITVRNDDGHAIIEIPVTAGVVAAVIAPVLVAVAALAALAGSWEIVVDRAPGDITDHAEAARIVGA